jgi:alkyl hydroperoxide reductase subunit AhpC
VILVRTPAPPLRARALLPDGSVGEVSLEALRGRTVVLAFYPRDFTTVCPTEVLELSKRARELRALGAEVVALSVDGVETHRRWVAEVLGPLQIPLAEDAGGAHARAFGVWMERDGMAARATIVVDPEGVVRHAACYDLSVGRSVSETLRVIEALRTRENVPAEWIRGAPTLGA